MMVTRNDGQERKKPAAGTVSGNGLFGYLYLSGSANTAETTHNITEPLAQFQVESSWRMDGNKCAGWLAAKRSEAPEPRFLGESDG